MIFFSYWGIFLFMGGLGAVLGFIFRDRDAIKEMYKKGYKDGYRAKEKEIKKDDNKREN